MSLLVLLRWLYSLVHNSVSRMLQGEERSNGGDLAPLVEKCCDIITLLISTKPSRAMLHIATLEDKGQFEAARVFL